MPKPAKPAIAAIIFDFDGLIIDSESAAYDAWCDIYKDHGCVLSLSDWVACVGSGYGAFDPVTNLAKLSGRTFDDAARAALFATKERRKIAVCDGLAALPGVTARLHEATSLNLPLAVASSSPRGWLEVHLTRLGLRQAFKTLTGKEDVPRIKPFPDVYLHAAKQLGVEPSCCLVFEDSLNGVKAAKAAGMRCIAVPGPITRGLDLSAADAVVASLADVSLAAWLGKA